MATKAFCIHGHFYQPPREDPLTAEIPLEPGAAPYRNWNERIHDQCYRPNAELGNFEKISFNIGPTLFQWMEEFDPVTVSRIVTEERRNFAKYGVGNAMAQAYNHTILPLSARHDKITQVRWGIADFEHRFGHKPIGLWLPETAVDEETLEVLVDCEIQFTILAPWQAATDNVDFSQPYWVSLSEGRKIAVFFYDQALSTRISFDPSATINADRFVWETLMPEFRMSTRQLNVPQMILIASDGELYGHHQPFRDKFLAYLMDGAVTNQLIEKTFPALWLKENPPTQHILVRPNTSWSCHHGVTRWEGACGCTPNSGWKAPLRNALNYLANLLDQQYLDIISPYIGDPWQLRHEYIHVILGEIKLEELIRSVIAKRLDETEVRKVRLLLAAQSERQRMFTSCGWFFDDFDRIEPRNNVAYAAQAVWLTRMATGVDLTKPAMNHLHQVKSWRSGLHADVVFAHHILRARNSQ